MRSEQILVLSMIKEINMFNSPAGGSGELFPSPVKGHTDEGLSGEQSSDTQTLIDSALSGYYQRGTVDNLLAGKQPTIGEGSLSQSKVTNLVADLAGKQPIVGEGSLAQSKVHNLTSDLAAKASTQQLATGSQLNRSSSPTTVYRFATCGSCRIRSMLNRRCSAMWQGLGSPCSSAQSCARCLATVELQ